MNEQNNTQTVKDAYGRFQNGDINGVLNLFSEDINWRTPVVEGSPMGGERRGLNDIRQFFTLLEQNEEITKFEPKEFIAQGDRVVALVDYASKVKSTNRPMETELVHIFTVENGKITNFVEHFDTAKAQRAYQRATTA